MLAKNFLFPILARDFLMRKFFRLILASVFAFLMFGMAENTAMATKVTTDLVGISDPRGDMITTEDHGSGYDGPHIPAPKGDIIEGWTIGGLHITNTVFSTWIFM
jgi:hypothetical protein